MESESYPTSIAELAAWQKANKVTAEEARRRLVQFVVLASIGFSAELVSRVALKGGNALRFVYGNQRSTTDLDFTAEGGFPDDAEAIRGLLNTALKTAERQFQVKARCQAIRRNPKNPERTFPTYRVTVCYQLPTDRHYQNFEERKQISQIVELEISLNDILCETVETMLRSATNPIRVCSLEDILAEKLRALLQQPIRERSRPQDVYDIASRVRKNRASIDLEKISDFLTQKSTARGIIPHKSSYDEAVKSRAMVNYKEEIRVQITEFIPFEEAWSEVVNLVNQLNIPD